MVEGGSYLPQQEAQVPQTSVPAQGIANERDMRGRASDVNDFSLTMSGIADGDPVGMETFDLGFFEDGTPAITINGANVPIRHEQWMALLTQRNRSRTELRERMQFAVNQREAMRSVKSVLAAMPSLPQGMPELFMAQAQTDPDKARDNLQRLYLEMQKNGGRDMHGQMASDLLAARIAPIQQNLFAPQGETMIEVKDQFGNTTQEKVKLPSKAEQKSRELAKEGNNTASYWFANAARFLPNPEIKRKAPNMRYGVFDRIVYEEADRVGPMSMFEGLKQIAANGTGVFPQQIPYRESPRFLQSDPNSGTPGRVPNPSEQLEFLNYMYALDQWAANAFGTDASSRESIQAMVQTLAERNSVPASQWSVPAPQPTGMTTPATGARNNAMGN
jgi:hypothetical protein